MVDTIQKLVKIILIKTLICLSKNHNSVHIHGLLELNNLVQHLPQLVKFSGYCVDNYPRS